MQVSSLHSPSNLDKIPVFKKPIAAEGTCFCPCLTHLPVFPLPWGYRSVPHFGSVVQLSPKSRVDTDFRLGLSGFYHSALGNLWGSRSYSLSGQPAPLLACPNGEKVFPDIWSEHQLISSSPHIPCILHHYPVCFYINLFAFHAHLYVQLPVEFSLQSIFLINQISPSLQCSTLNLERAEWELKWLLV